MEQLRQIQLTDADWSLNPEIMQILQLTLHPPHAVHNKKIVSSPTFPFCFYGSEGRLGQEHYCNAFQTTFNEYGLCYTFNNAHQGLQEYFSNETFWQRKGNLTIQYFFLDFFLLFFSDFFRCFFRDLFFGFLLYFILEFFPLDFFPVFLVFLIFPLFFFLSI